MIRSFTELERSLTAEITLTYKPSLSSYLQRGHLIRPTNSTDIRSHPTHLSSLSCHSLGLGSARRVNESSVGRWRGQRPRQRRHRANNAALQRRRSHVRGCEAAAAALRQRGRRARLGLERRGTKTSWVIMSWAPVVTGMKICIRDE